MEEQRKYTKLSALIDSEFTIDKVYGYKFKKWDTDSGRMLSEDNWFEGARKVYQVETDKGTLDLSESQLGTIMVKVSHAGASDVIGCTVAVKSNGETGINIRYFLNPVKTAVRSSEDENLSPPEGW